VKLKPKKLILLFFLLFYSHSAFAHRVNVFAWVEDQTLYIESKFAGGKFVKHGKVTIIDPFGNELFSGLTDEKGNTSFQIQKVMDHSIIVNAGEGHQGTWKVFAHEISGHEPEDHEATTVLEQRSNIQSTNLNCISEDQITKILDEKLKSVHGQLKIIRQNKENKIRDIMSGIGFILGIFGIFALMKSRKNQP
jgi:nickel transport protein